MEIDADGLGTISPSAWAAVARRVVGKKEKALAPLAMLARRPASVDFKDVRQWRQGLLTETVTVEDINDKAFGRLLVAGGEAETKNAHPGWPVFTFDPTAAVEAGCPIAKTEERGILLAQLVMVWKHIAKHCEAEGWADWQGNKLAPKKVSLYDLNTYLILPATMRRRCSFVEFVAAAGMTDVLRCPDGHVRMEQNPGVFMLDKETEEGLDQTCSACGSVQRPGTDVQCG